MYGSTYNILFDWIENMTEYDLIVKYKLDGDLVARNQIIENQLNYINFCAMPYYHSSNYHDIVQEGVIALMSALEKYDHTAYNVKLTSFAKRDISSKMYRYFLKNNEVVTKYTTKELERLYNNRNKYNMTDVSLRDTIIEELNITAKDLDRYNSMGAICDIDAFFDISSSQPTPEEAAMQLDEQVELKTLRGMVDRLDMRSRDIITGRWLNDMPDTLNYFGKKYGVSKERIRQIESESFVKVKMLMQENSYHI